MIFGTGVLGEEKFNSVTGLQFGDAMNSKQYLLTKRTLIVYFDFFNRGTLLPGFVLRIVPAGFETEEPNVKHA